MRSRRGFGLLDPDACAWCFTCGCPRWWVAPADGLPNLRLRVAVAPPGLVERIARSRGLRPWLATFAPPGLGWQDWKGTETRGYGGRAWHFDWWASQQCRLVERSGTRLATVTRRPTFMRACKALDRAVPLTLCLLRRLFDPRRERGQEGPLTLCLLRRLFDPRGERGPEKTARADGAVTRPPSCPGFLRRGERGPVSVRCGRGRPDAPYVQRVTGLRRVCS